MIKGMLPEQIIYQGEKKGFTPPINLWIENEEFKSSINKALNQLESVDSMLHEFYTHSVLVDNSKNASCIIYKMRLLLFDNWMEKWITS